MENYQLVRAYKDDLEQVWDMFCEVKAQGTSQWSDEYPTKDIVEYDIENRLLYVFKNGKDIISAISLMPEDDLDDADIPWTDVKSCVLSRLCVKANLQGRGIGKLVMERITNQARLLGYKATRHLADVKNAAAVALYNNMGYINKGTVDMYGCTFYCFEKLF